MTKLPGKSSEVPLKVFHEAAPARVAASRPAAQHEPDLREYVDTVIGGRWIIATTTIAACLAGVLYLFFATPVYEADAVVQIEERKSTLAGLEDLSSAFSSASPADTEIEIIRSRMLAGSVVDELRLNIVAEPRYFPVFGRGLARRRPSDQVAQPSFGLESYAWGGERIAVEQLDVPQSWAGKTLTLVAREHHRYELLDPAGKPLGSGEVGKRFDANGVFLLVTELVARDGTRFEVASLPRADVVQALQGQIAATEKMKKTGVLRIALQGADPVRVAQIVDSVARTYLRQNVERKSAEAAKTLEFVNDQLPELKQEVEKAEAALNEYRKARGGVDVTLETRAALDRTAEVEKVLTQIQMQRSELEERFTPSHPALEALNRKYSQLIGERAQLEKQLKSLPETELHAARLMRDVKVSSELYVLLLNRAQELQVIKSGTIGNVRILDVPQPPTRPVKPVPSVVMLVSIIAGAGLGVVVAFARKALDQSVDDPDAIEAATGFPVVTTVPHSPSQRGEPARRKSAASAVLASSHPDDVSIEAIRSLRTSLQVALTEARNNVVSITGPSPGIGKSFIAVNLAQVAAIAGKRVLLVDGDMRKGTLHQCFCISKTPGLSDLVRGNASLKEVTRATASENLFLITCGTRPSNPSELLSSGSLQEVLATLSRDFDIIVVDTPPLLAVTDAALIGRLAGTNLLVLRAGHHAIGEIKLATRRLEQNGVMPWGIVLNDLMPSLSGYSRYHYHYDYR